MRNFFSILLEMIIAYCTLMLEITFVELNEAYN